MSFAYLADKIRSAEFRKQPFHHLQINNLFERGHFAEIISAPEVSLSNLADDEALFDALFDNGYEIIDFAGGITDKAKYIRWHREKHRQQEVGTSTGEGFGVTLRLMTGRSPIIKDLIAFMQSTAFLGALAEKFSMNLDDVFHDAEIQKYLDGYEMNPHPEQRAKALAYMVNINPAPNSERLNHHTHYLRLHRRFGYIRAYWEGNPNLDRCWVPWDWCDTIKVQRENNSMVIFAPSNDTMHGVKARYDHLANQRTQITGNLWYKELPTRRAGEPKWEDLVIWKGKRRRRVILKTLSKTVVPVRAKDALRGAHDVLRERVLGRKAVGAGVSGRSKRSSN